MPKLNYVNNNNHSKIELLDEIDMALNELLRMENLKQYPGFAANVQKSKRFLDTTIQKIKFNYILQTMQIMYKLNSTARKLY